MTGDTQSAASAESHETPPNEESSDESEENPLATAKNLEPGRICVTSCRYDGKTLGAARNASILLLMLSCIS